jgi:hypothetical protein
MATIGTGMVNGLVLRALPEGSNGLGVAHSDSSLELGVEVY